MIDKSPEEYFQSQNFSTDLPPDAKPGEFTAAERAFMEKYMGVDAGAALQAIGLAPPPVPGPGAAEAGGNVIPAEEREESLDAVIRRAPELLMVGFFLGEQEYVVPTLAVQEVIRYSAPAKLPAAPKFVAGVINLRGKVTPLIRLRDLLDPDTAAERPNQFIIVCRRNGLQFGLIIDRVHTMYRVPKDDIDWGIETHLGANVDFIAGLLKLGENLVGIVSVDRIMEVIIQK